MKKWVFFIIGIVFCIGALLNPSPILSDELDDINRQIDDLTSSLNDSIKATKPLESQLATLRQQIIGIKQRVAAIESDIIVKKKHIDQGYKNLEKQEVILSASIRDFYINSYYDSPLLAFFAAPSASELTQVLAYQKAATNQDKAIITNIALSLADLETKKKNLEGEQKKLASAKLALDEQSGKLDEVVKGAKAYQAKLSSEISQLSAKQQELVAQKLGSLNLPKTVGVGGIFCTDDRKLDPGFSPGFAFFTFGIPHRVGMNQYGALGRANAGQSYQDILRAYYEGISLEKRDPNMRLKVQGYGEKSLEEYMLGIAEMPANWPLEALKAQAVAARSYALAYTNNGQGEICTTQACQVYNGSNRGGNWEQAVQATAGEVMVQSGQVITAWYASTFGGYAKNSGEVFGNNKPWTKNFADVTSGLGGEDSFDTLKERAFDKESPCFYSAQGWRNEYAKSAWLKVEETADIVNALMLAKRDSSIQKHLSQTDRPNPDGTETWNSDRVKQELRNRGGVPYNSISDISVQWDRGGGKTTTISINGDAGTNSFDGAEFKNFFNLRAPANIQIVGPLYNVEKK